MQLVYCSATIWVQYDTATLMSLLAKNVFRAKVLLLDSSPTS